ncbi:MAG: hypothetical protein KC550_05935, partial [Nanoarchaeota archaeon]|nr:hypothetical protein [Nanoarchaeota archaeon]
IINTSGNYSIDYYTTDNAGNSNNISNINVVLDFTAPVTTDDAPTGWQTSPFNITLNASDLGSGLNKTYYRINFGPWINNLIIPITNSGIYSIDYYSVDYAGYVEPTNSFSVHLDMELPTSSDNAPTGWQTNPFNISLTGNDSYSNINYITYRIDGANWTNGTNILINNSGNYTLEYYAVDIAGNTQSPKTTNILLDTYLENITYNISADWQITPYNISLNISDNVSGIDYVSYRLNGGNWTNSSLIIANQSGYFNVDFFAADKAGNILPINNFSIKLDLDLPYTTDTSPVGWRKTPFNIILSSNDDTSGVVYTSYRLNNGSWINGTLVPINIAGNHTLEYFAQDLAGNYELIKNVSAKLDNLAPNSSDNAPITNWYSNPLNISLNASDIHTGVSYISYRVYGSNWTNGTNLIINTSGNHSFQYFSVDNLGNIETIKTKYISLDFDSPITTDDAPSVWQSTPFLITLSASDNASGVLNTTYRINGGNWTNGTIIFINSPGNYSIEYFSSDLAGNIENINYISVGLDILKPTTSDNAPSSWQNSSFNITLNATDDAQVAYTNYRINGASWKSGTNIVINSSGNFTIDYHSVDSIGNVENIKTINVLLDLTKPNASDNALNSWQTSPYNITLAGNDTFSGLEQIYYRINGGNWTNGTKIIINSSANHSIEYYAKDKANNTNQIKNIFGLMDISKPITSDDAPIGWQTSSFNINLNASDTGIGVSNT